MQLLFGSRGAAFSLSLACALSTGALANSVFAATGPSSSQSPYLQPLNSTTSFTSVMTVGDTVPRIGGGAPYAMVGIPDGMGAFDNGNGTFTALMNHELRGDVGALRAHGATGAFVSKWIINKSDLRVVSGGDLIQRVATWNVASNAYNAPAQGVVIGRLCSADLAAPTAFFSGSRGTRERIFMSGEEIGAEGRAFAHLMDGTSYELPRLGKFSWENAAASPFRQNKTVVVGTDDTTPGQVYIYIGEKQAGGRNSTLSEIDKAGLTNGNLFGVKVAGFASEPVAGFSQRAFSLHPFGNVSAKTGATLQSESVRNGVTEWLRPEDCAWDPNNPNDLYFATTASFTGPSRLWRLRFRDITQPTLGGVAQMLLDGTEGHKMLDNLCVTKSGTVLLQEDPGGQDYLARIWRYDIATGTLVAMGQHDPNRFAPNAPAFLTRDEESSGIIPLDEILGKGTFLFNVQAHYPISGELVEGGQMLVMRQTVSALDVSVSAPSSYAFSSPAPLALSSVVKNVGAGTLKSATFTQTVPRGVTIESVTDEFGSFVRAQISRNTVRINLGTLNPEEGRKFIVNVRPSVTDSLETNVAARATGEGNRRVSDVDEVTVDVTSSNSNNSASSASAPSSNQS